MSRRGDLALGRDASGRFLPGLVAAMTFLAALAVAGALAAHGLVERWDLRLADVLTVEVPPPLELDGPELDARMAEREQAVLRLLRVTPGVARATPVPPEEAAALLEPWLGEELVKSLPMPRLIDVRIAHDQPLDRPALAERLENAAPGTTLDDNGRWLGDVRTLASAVAVAAAAVLLLVAAAVVAAVVFAVRTGMAVHSDEIEILHLIGASDRYVAAQFQRHVGRLSGLGGVLGTAAAVGVLWGLERLVAERAADTGPAGIAALLGLVGLGPLGWLCLAAVPPTAVVIAVLAARASVLRTLARLG